jgi:hypothetical protein
VKAQRLTCDNIACWASAGYGVSGCQALETQLRACMDTPVSLSIQFQPGNHVYGNTWL